MSRTLKKDVVLVFALLLCMYAYFYQDPGWNGNSRIGLVLAFVQEGRFTIDSFHTMQGIETGDESFRNGHYYSDKAIGSSLIGAVVYTPVYWLAKLINYDFNLWSIKHLLTFFVIGLPSAIGGSLVYVACTYVTTSKLQSYIATLAITLGTLWFPYSVVFFGHALAASLLFWAFFLIFRLRHKHIVPPHWYRFLIGLVLGFALITEYTTTLIVVPLIIYYIYVTWHEQANRKASVVGIPVIGGLLPLGSLAIYNTICFGNPLSPGYAHVENPMFKNAMSQGLLGVGRPQLKVMYYLTVHPAHGLFWQSPVLLLSLLGTYFMLCTLRYRAEACITIVAFCSYLIMNSGYYAWWGHWAAGPRHLVPMLPFLCLPLLFVPKRLWFFMVLFSFVSVAQMLLVAASTVQVPDDQLRKIDQLSYFQYSSIYSYCLRQLVDGTLTWNMAQKVLGWGTAMSLLPIMVVVACITACFMRHAAHGEQPFVERHTPM